MDSCSILWSSSQLDENPYGKAQDSFFHLRLLFLNKVAIPKTWVYMEAGQYLS